MNCSRKSKNPEPDERIINKIEPENSIIDSTNIDSNLDSIDNTMISQSETMTDFETKNEEIIPLNSMSIKESTPFYELEKSMKEILLKISYLEAHILIDERTIPTTSYTEKIKNLIDGPRKKHQISLHNESIIEGFIEKDNETNVMVMTSVGRLTIEKDKIASIEEITALEPNIIFIGHGLEQEFETHYLFTGKILNQGTQRGDFIQVIFKLWADDTNMLYSDSVFVEGEQIKYESGIVTDTALNPNKSARYTLKIPLESNIPVSYITREIHWLKYN